MLARRIELVETAYGNIRVKVVARPDGSETAEPEFEDVSAAAIAKSATFTDVRAAALAAFSSMR